MTHRAHFTGCRETIQLLAKHGFDGLAEVLELLLKELMKIEGRTDELGSDLVVCFSPVQLAGMDRGPGAGGSQMLLVLGASRAFDARAFAFEFRITRRCTLEAASEMVDAFGTRHTQ